MREFWKFLKTAGAGWLGVWLLVYLAFLILDIFYDDILAITVLKYGGLVLCFLYALTHSRGDVYLILALLLTLIADGLLISNNISVLGVGIFLTVQSVHLVRFSQIRANSPLVIFLAAGLILAVGFLQREIPIMFVLATAYGILIFANIYQAAKWYLTERTYVAKMALLGFIMFLLCDICVAISYLTTTATLPEMVTIVSNYLAWFFYFPSQVMITLSGKRADFEKLPEMEELPELTD